MAYIGAGAAPQLTEVNTNTVETQDIQNGAVTAAKLATGAAASNLGTLGVSGGGTGVTSLTANNIILGNGTSAVQFVAPGSSGNVLTSDGTTWTSAAAAGGGGKVLQVIHTQYKGAQSIQSASYVSTNVTGTITPTSATSKILVCVNVFVGSSGGLEGAHFQLYRNGSQVSDAIGDAASNRDRTWFHVGEQSAGHSFGCGAAMYLDSPATTSATTYTLYARCYSGAASAVIKINASESDTDFSYVSRTVSSVTLWEIAA